MLTLCLVAHRNICWLQKKTIENKQKTRRDTLERFYSRPLVLSSPSQPYSRDFFFPPNALCRNCADHLKLCAVFGCKLQHQREMTIMLDKIISCNPLTLCSGVRPWAFSKGDIILRNIGIISKELRHLWETSRATQRPRGHRLRMAVPREDHALP